jgi:excisionase family DNA binding protein
VSTDDLLTVEDVAHRLRVSDETVRQWLRTEQLSGYNFGGRTGWRIPASEVERLLASKAGKRRPSAP